MVLKLILSDGNDSNESSVLSFQDDKQATCFIRKNFPLLWFDSQFPYVGKRTNFAIRMAGVENDVVRVCRYSRLIIVDRSEITTVIIRSFEMSKPSMRVIRRSDPRGHRNLLDHFLKFRSARSGNVQILPAIR